MPIGYPDEIKHNNPAYAMVDDSEFRGGVRSVLDQAALEAIPTDKRKLLMLVSLTISGTKKTLRYDGVDLEDINWQNMSNWTDISLASTSGDRLKSTYDPNSKDADAFDMDNMEEGSVNAIISLTEKSTYDNKPNLGELSTEAYRGDRGKIAYDHSQVTHNKTLIGLGNVDNVQQIPLSQKGANSGVASLDASGKVPASQLNISAGLSFKGTFGTAGSTTGGDVPSVGLVADSYWICDTNGFTSTIAGDNFDNGDWAVYTSTGWYKVDNAQAIQSVFGRTGVVVAQSGDYDTDKVTEAGNLYYTEGRVDSNTNVAANTAKRHDPVTVEDSTEIDLTLTGQKIKADLKNTTVNVGTYNNPTVTVDAKGRVTEIEEGATPTGDMPQATYDPDTIEGDVFDMDNMKEGTTNKLVSSGEKDAWNGKIPKISTPTTNNLVKQNASGEIIDTGIASSDVVKKDGSVPLTGDLQAGGNKLTGVADATQVTDAATLNQLIKDVNKRQTITFGTTVNFDVENRGKYLGYTVADTAFTLNLTNSITEGRYSLLIKKTIAGDSLITFGAGSWFMNLTGSFEVATELNLVGGVNSYFILEMINTSEGVFVTIPHNHTNLSIIEKLGESGGEPTYNSEQLAKYSDISAISIIGSKILISSVAGTLTMSVATGRIQECHLSEDTSLVLSDILGNVGAMPRLIVDGFTAPWEFTLPSECVVKSGQVSTDKAGFVFEIIDDTPGSEEVWVYITS